MTRCVVSAQLLKTYAKYSQSCEQRLFAIFQTSKIKFDAWLAQDGIFNCAFCPEINIA